MVTTFPMGFAAVQKPKTDTEKAKQLVEMLLESTSECVGKRETDPAKRTALRRSISSAVKLMGKRDDVKCRIEGDMVYVFKTDRFNDCATVKEA